MRQYKDIDLQKMMEIWNEVVADGVAFPQTDPLDLAQAAEFFGAQDYTGVAELDGEVCGLYILHPNNVWRCGHIANASYAVKKGMRGNHIGEMLVKNSLHQASLLGYRIMQFNAVVATNYGAINLYRRIGFKQLGVISEGFHMPVGSYQDICPFYISLLDK